MKKEFKQDNFLLKIQSENINFDNIDINIFNHSYSEKNPSLYLALAPLWRFEDEFRETMRTFRLGLNGNKTILKKYKDIQDNFIVGDYYQSAVTKYDTSFANSYLAILHKILLKNKSELTFIKRIFSTSLNGYNNWEQFITPNAIRFWDKQLKVGKPFSFFKEDNRYLFTLNE